MKKVESPADHIAPILKAESDLKELVRLLAKYRKRSDET